MTKYARIKDGHLIDVYRVPEDFPDFGALEKSLPGGGFVQVPSGVVHGAKDNGDDTYTNPAAKNAPLVRGPLTLLGFLRLCQSAGGMTDEMLVQCKEDPGFAAFWIKFTIAEEIVYGDEDTEMGLAGLEMAEYLPNGAAAVKEAWPVK